MSEDSYKALVYERHQLAISLAKVMADRERLQKDVARLDDIAVKAQADLGRAKREVERQGKTACELFDEVKRQRLEIDAWKLKVEALAGALRDLLNHGMKYENGEIHIADPDGARAALQAYEKGGV